MILIGAEDNDVQVRRVRPPNQAVSDSVSIKASGEVETIRRTISATAGTVGDRVYFAADEHVIAIRTRDLGIALNVDMGDPVMAIAATPSGDRLFVALEDESVLRIVDRFEEGVTGRIRSFSPASALRMDPMGRMLLARGAGDSVYVVSLGGDAVIGVVRSEWRADLPLVMADGSIAITRAMMSCSRIRLPWPICAPSKAAPNSSGTRCVGTVCVPVRLVSISPCSSATVRRGTPACPRPEEQSPP